MTSAPRSPRTCPQNGPASTRDASRTRTPCNGNRLSAIGFPVCFGTGEKASATTLPGLLEHFLSPPLCKQARPALSARHRLGGWLHTTHGRELTSRTSWLLTQTRVRIDDYTDLAPLPQGKNPCSRSHRERPGTNPALRLPRKRSTRLPRLSLVIGHGPLSPGCSS